MITDTTVRRRLTLHYYKDVCEISEGGKPDREVTPQQASALVKLMESYVNFFIVDSTPRRNRAETLK